MHRRMHLILTVVTFQWHNIYTYSLSGVYYRTHFEKIDEHFEGEEALQIYHTRTHNRANDIREIVNARLQQNR